MKLDGIKRCPLNQACFVNRSAQLGRPLLIKEEGIFQVFPEALLPGTVGRNNLVGWQNRDIEVDLLKLRRDQIDCPREGCVI